MAKNFKKNNEEIELIELLQAVWEGKGKIALAVIISFIVSTIHLSTQRNNFTAITEIKPIKILELNNYLNLNDLIKEMKARELNRKKELLNFENAEKKSDSFSDEFINFKIPEIKRSLLLNIYIDILRDKSVFEEAIRKFNLLDSSKYNNDQEYEEEISKLASSIKILSTLNKDTQNLDYPYHTINFQYHDKEKWKKALKYSNELANKIAYKSLFTQFNNHILNEKIRKKFQIENLSLQINNIKVDYERKATEKLAFLFEQSEIAKELGIKKNTLETLSLGKSQLLANIQTDSPFYLRGYEAIDKEIDLILNRTNKEAFMLGLFDLEKKKRNIEQNKDLERFLLVLQSNPKMNIDDFSAASMNVLATNFEFKKNTLIFAITIGIGLIIGVFYVLVSNAIQSKRVSKRITN